MLFSGVTLVVDAGGKLGSCRMAGKARSFWWLSQRAALPVLEFSPADAKAFEKEIRHRCYFVLLTGQDAPVVLSWALANRMRGSGCFRFRLQVVGPILDGTSLSTAAP
jgi:hypothetical protein